MNPLEIGKLKITKCKVGDDGITSLMSGDENIYVTNINPASLKHSRSVTYSGEATDKEKLVNKSETPARYSGTNPEEISFDIILDGTGVLRSTQLQMLKDMSTTKVVMNLLEKLRKIVYVFVGTEHRTNVVQITWGAGIEFTGVLKTMNVDYTLFHPLGNPLRAKVSMSFRSFKSAKEISVTEKKSSPDLTHHVIVRAGDTLPLLCQRIYKDSSKYAEVARHNGLDGFRYLKPGTELTFPPMR